MLLNSGVSERWWGEVGLGRSRRMTFFSAFKSENRNSHALLQPQP